MKTPTVTQTFDPWEPDGGDAVAQRIHQLAEIGQNAQALTNQAMLIARYYTTRSGATGSIEEWYSACMVKPSSLGGEGGGNIGMPVDVTYGGERTIGEVMKDSDGEVISRPSHKKVIQWSRVINMEELRARMTAIEDRRQPSYVKYPLAGILIIVMCAVLCGLDTLGDLVVYAKNKHEFLAKEFGIEEIPSKATFARVLSTVSGKETGDAVLDILRIRFGAAGEVIAVDGKVIRSTAKPGVPPQRPANFECLCD